MVGHCLAASGAVESVAAVLQLQHNFIAPNLNCEDLHPEISRCIDPKYIPKQYIETPLKTVVKASFGFGDVNACVIFRKN